MEVRLSGGIITRCHVLPANSLTLVSRQKRQDYDLTSLRSAKAVPCQLTTSRADEAWQIARADFGGPRLRGDTKGLKSLFRDCVFSGEAADANALWSVCGQSGSVFEMHECRKRYSAWPNVRAEAGPAAKRQARAVENAPAHCAGLAF